MPMVAYSLVSYDLTSD